MINLIGNKANEEFMNGRGIGKIDKAEIMQASKRQKEKIIKIFAQYLGSTKKTRFFWLESMKPGENLYKELTAEFSSEVVDEFIKESLNSI